MNAKTLVATLLVLFVVGCGSDTQKKSFSNGNNENNGNNINNVNNVNNTNNANNSNNGDACGNGQLDEGELCDSGIEFGDGACPNTCPSQPDACGTFTLTGSPSDCSATCVFEPVGCMNGDGCCPVGCDSTTDSECTNVCGDGTVDGNETCDGDCPTSCDDNDACTVDSFSGSADTCSLLCSYDIKTACINGDGCCPAGCTTDNDDDCSGSCGNDMIDENETCDGDCPTSCNDNNVCTADALSGSAENCNAQCVYSAITTCASGDGCCPTGCTAQIDGDCMCTPTTSCQAVNFDCGQFFDGCRDVSCGTCSNNEMCVNNRCETNVTTDVGNACTGNGQCSLSACITQDQSGWSGGYCSGACRTSAQCGTGAICGLIDDNGDGLCLKACSSNSDCRTGYQCYDRDEDGANECAPVASGNRAIGDSCTLIQQCSGGQDGTCIREGNDWQNGYCTEFCTSNADCPSGSNCFDGVLCADNCTSNAQCRSGYLCIDRDGNGQRECLPGATGSTPPGGSCTNTWNCNGGEYGFCANEAETGFPGGYCIIDCDPNNGNSCPSGSTCWASQDSGFLCVETCPNGNECRSGYQCYNPDGFANEDICWP